MGLENPKISVVVPAYNVEGYLGACLDSLAAQTFGDFEAVCVDDGSTDGTRAILDEYAARDRRFCVIGRENGGVSAARNTALDAARGEFVTFLDADDLFEPDALETIVAHLDYAGAPEGVMFGARIIPEGAGDPWTIEHLSPRDARYAAFDPKLIFDEIAYPYVHVGVRRALLEGAGFQALGGPLRFDPALAVGEDEAFLMELYTQAMGIELLSRKLYVYRAEREGSAMAGVDMESTEMCRRHLLVIRHVLGYWKHRYPGNEHLAAIVRWSVDYVLQEIFVLGENGGALADEYRDILLGLWSREELESCGIDKADWGFVASVLDGLEVSGAKSIRMRVARKVRDEGVAKTIGRVFGRMLAGR